MMGFIAYAQNLEQTVKLLTFCKNVNFNEAHDKNRIFVTGTAMMSTKLSTSAAAIQKATDALQNPNNHNSTIHVGKIKRTCVLDRAQRSIHLKKMKDNLQVVVDLQQKYVELNEFKRVSCVDVNIAIPEIKPGVGKSNEMNNCNNNFA